MTYLHYIERRFLTPNQCNTVINYLENSTDSIREKEGQVYHDLDWNGPDYDWLYDKCWRTVTTFNKSSRGWGFDITDWQQELRVSRYDGGAGMDWHMDYTADDMSKVAFSVALSDPHDYTGGDLHLLETKPLARLQCGQGVVFPAFAGHKVDPVTSGTRYVLLGWLTGPRFV
jgi:PKHD-type hydroxylase